MLLSSTISQITGTRQTPGNLYGVEVEAEFVNPVEFRTTPIFRVKGDGSLRNYGLEFVSVPIPLKEISGWEDIRVQAKASKAEFLDVPRTSTHVHINVADLPLVKALTVLTALYLCEHVLVRAGGPSRKGNLFCLPANHSLHKIRDFSSAIKNYAMFQTSPDHRYAGTSVTSLAKFGTFELRMMRGLYTTDELELFLRNVEAVKLLALRFGNPQHLLDEYYRVGPDLFAFLKELVALDKTVPAFFEKDIELGESAAMLIAESTEDDWSGEKDWRNSVDDFLMTRGYGNHFFISHKGLAELKNGGLFVNPFARRAPPQQRDLPLGPRRDPVDVNDDRDLDGTTEEDLDLDPFDDNTQIMFSSVIPQ